MRHCVLLAIVLCPSTALCDFITNGEDGINSLVTGLTGSGVQIGQVELTRSGKAGYDNEDNSVPNTIPAGVYFQNSGGMDSPNSGRIDEHATSVAQIAAAKTTPSASYAGVAPNSELHSLAVADYENDDTNALALNRLALLNSGAIKAINLSYYRPLQFTESPDGRSRFAQFVDWSARRHDILYVVGWGNTDSDPFRTPADNYNGMTVASSELDEGDLVFRRYSSFNSDSGYPVGDRSAISLLAPGIAVPVITLDGQEGFATGSSFAAPHVTGATALLQQYSQQQIDANNPRFTPGINPSSQRHELMKAVMMNAADKLTGVHGSTRTVCDAAGPACIDWTQSEAYNNSFIPLDDKMGAGHLNVARAVQQLSPGEYDPGPVPKIGWDYGTIGPDETAEYDLSDVSGYIAITLAWDRIVNHTGGNTYSSGDQFFPYLDVDAIVNNLDIHLVNASSGIVFAESISQEMNLEHIFFDIETPGDYKIVVEHNGGLDTTQAYALTWWNGVPAASPPGDYDKNGSVGPEDYDMWKTNFGTSFADADGNGNGLVDAADYTIWRNNFAGSGSLSNGARAKCCLAADGRIGLLRLASRAHHLESYRPHHQTQHDGHERHGDEHGAEREASRGNA